MQQNRYCETKPCLLLYHLQALICYVSRDVHGYISSNIVIIDNHCSVQFSGRILPMIEPTGTKNNEEEEILYV